MNHPNRVYTRSFTIPEDAIDENGHVNNVAFHCERFEFLKHALLLRFEVPALRRDPDFLLLLYCFFQYRFNPALLCFAFGSCIACNGLSGAVA